MQALEPGGVGAVERLRIRTTHHLQVERVVGGADRGSVEGHVEALEAEVRVKAERGRNAAAKLLGELAIELRRRGNPRNECSWLGRAERSEAGEPVDVPG